MENEIVTYNPTASLVDIRMDSEKFPRFKYYDRVQKIKGMVGLVTASLMYKGQEKDIDTITFMATALVDEIEQDAEGVGLPNLTFEEMSRAIRKAVLGVSGQEMYGINVSSLYKVLVDYAVGEGHQAQEAANRRVKAQQKLAHDQSGVTEAIENFANALVSIK